jgi:transcriptional repressor NrdR
MQCPYCQDGETKVVDKRDVEGRVKRRRECLKCGRRFNTKEGVESSGLRVLKKDGRREEFDREKIRRGIEKACEKRPVSKEQTDKMIYSIEEKLRRKGKDVGSDAIGELVSRELRRLDKVAYLRFTSVYKDFDDIDDFKSVIADLNLRKSKDITGFRKEIKGMVKK